MFRSRLVRILAMGVCALAAARPSLSLADDMASFATGGYSRGLHSMDLMHKMDTDGDGCLLYTSRRVS